MKAIKLKDLIKANSGISKLADIILPNGKDNYRVYKIFKIVQDEINYLESQKVKILEKYGTKQSDGSITIAANHPDYLSALKLLTELGEVEVTFPEDLLGVRINPLEAKLSPKDLYELETSGIIQLVEEE
ncbi:hypothetical protein [Tissierella praeacuta]|uniref:hypothetical protein n=1 Tax=Tissierella praeacuta TaxID=43131 RepID=UPI0028A8985D|nr:hypothetical protein [Tissierella praeacuta]